jgi:phosphatidylserine/phosphatidylglycerophosphate/cardiolipin synthase-like enzyme
VIPALLALETSSLKALADAIDRGELDTPTALGLRYYCPASQVQALLDEIKTAWSKGLTSSGLAILVKTLVTDRERRAAQEAGAELVWSGPELEGDYTRDTRIVVHELFRKARKRALVSTYALYQGEDLFLPLHETMAVHPELKVTLFLDIARGDADLPDANVLAQFREKFLKDNWPWKPVPEIYYYPKSLEKAGTSKRACLHAKTVVVDGRDVFLTSANLTEAAQQRNIEAGLLLRSPQVATQVEGHFKLLMQQGHLQRL